jgi:RHS repeat-associated protein
VSNGVNVVTDRLGSVRANTQGDSFAYYPYGEERTTNANGLDKFGTYFRDAVGQDYADQRYYNGGLGRFWTVDPGGIKTAHLGNPTSWNRYGYVNGDPINFGDPTGLDCCGDGSPGTSASNMPGACAASSGGDITCGQVGILGGAVPGLWNFPTSFDYDSDVASIDTVADDTGDNGDDDDDDDDTTAGSPATFSTTVTASGNCVAAWTLGGAAYGAVVGGVVGAGVGGVAGGTAGTAVAPVFGTFLGAAAGGATGASEGAVVGGTAGSFVGGFLGSIFCSSEHTSNATPSHKPKHQRGTARKRGNRINRRDPPRKPPNGWKGPWPPPPGTPWH